MNNEKSLPAVMMRGPIGIDKKPFLLMLAEHLAETGHNIIYITKSLSHIPPALHGKQTSNMDAFARIHFRYLKNQEQLLETLLDLTFYEKICKHPHTIIIDGLETYFENNSYKDIAPVSSILLGALPQVKNDAPRLVTSFNYDPRRITNVHLNNCKLFYPIIWDLELNENDGISIKGSKSIIHFDKEEIDNSQLDGKEFILKLKQIIQ